MLFRYCQLEAGRLVQNVREEETDYLLFGKAMKPDGEWDEAFKSKN